MNLKPTFYFPHFLMAGWLMACATPGGSPVDIQGHRGARAKLPENSIPGFVYATELGVSTLELDLISTASGDLIVSHEPWLNPEICLGPDGAALPQGSKLSLYQLTADQIRSCDCGSLGNPRFPEQAPQPTYKPTLAEVVAAADAASRPEGAGPVQFNIEIKHEASRVGTYFPPAAEAARRAVAEFRRLGIVDRTTLQSFSAEVLEAVHAEAPEIRTSWLMEDELTVAEALALLTFKPDVYSPHHILLSPAEVAAAHEAGVAVVPWTVNEAARMAELLSWGVDGLISDDPDLALKVAEKSVQIQ
jgi:glycerophosphoryl diester phosphodiesterase